MGSIFSYAIASSILLCIGYLAFKWIMAGERQHACNRITLYLIYALALTLPAFAGNWEEFLHTPTQHATDSIEIGEISKGMVIGQIPSTNPFRIVPAILTAIYIAGATITFLYSLAGALQLWSIIQKGEKIKSREFTLVISERNDIAPFSWLRYYVMSRTDYVTAGEVISIHERRHLKLFHWIDLVFVQIMDIFQWFNPAAWLIGEEFKTIHEYQADEAVMDSGINIHQYQTLLIKKAVGTRFQVLANSLNHSKLKKRVTMMYKSKSSKSRRLGAVITIGAMALGCAVIEIPAVASALDKTAEVSFINTDNSKVSDFSANNINPTEENEIFSATDVLETPSSATITQETQTESTEDVYPKPSESANEEGVYEAMSENNATTSEETTISSNVAPKKEKDEVFVAVEQLAEFPGGVSSLMNWLSMNIKYPEKAFKENTQGRVIVKFIIGKDGKVSDPTIVKGVDSELDKEAIRVIKEMPAWQPAKNNGEPVASYFNLPISFKITDNSTEKEGTETPPAK